MNFQDTFQRTKSLNVLYIEDDQDFREETKELLEMLFKKVDTAANGLEGLALYQYFYNQNHYHYDIVISDLSMPKMDGKLLVTNIKKLNENQAVVMISAYSESEMLLDFIKLGIQDFLLKPISQDSLYDCFYNISKKLTCDIEFSPLNKNQNLVDDLLANPEEYEIDIYR